MCVNVDEAMARRSTPVAEEARLDVLGGERLAQERVLTEVDLSNREIVGCAPVALYAARQLGGERALRHLCGPRSRCCIRLHRRREPRVEHQRRHGSQLLTS